MPWPFHRNPRGETDTSGQWAGLLSALGRHLDQSGFELHDLALSFTGEEIWIVGNALWSQGEQGGWSSVTMRLIQDRLEIVGAPPRAGTLPVAASASARWQRTLGALGHLLDRSQRTLRNPTMLSLAEGLVVTADAQPDHGVPAYERVSLSFTAQELETMAGAVLRQGGRR